MGEFNVNQILIIWAIGLASIGLCYYYFDKLKKLRFLAWFVAGFSTLLAIIIIPLDQAWKLSEKQNDFLFSNKVALYHFIIIAILIFIIVLIFSYQRDKFRKKKMTEKN